MAHKKPSQPLWVYLVGIPISIIAVILWMFAALFIAALSISSGKGRE